jgi:hypothetical protein
MCNKIDAPILAHSHVTVMVLVAKPKIIGMYGLTPISTFTVST